MGPSENVPVMSACVKQLSNENNSQNKEAHRALEERVQLLERENEGLRKSVLETSKQVEQLLSLYNSKKENIVANGSTTKCEKKKINNSQTRFSFPGTDLERSEREAFIRAACRTRKFNYIYTAQYNLYNVD